jgi:hypothetical protein
MVIRPILVWIFAVSVGVTSSSAAADWRITPASILLDRPEATQQILVDRVAEPTGNAADDGRLIDLTRTATYESLSPAIAAVDETGLVEPRGEGRTEIVVRHQGLEVRVPVEVRGLVDPVPVSFEHDVIPILTKAGCNAGGCHGKAEGQNGFKLSVFGFDPAADHQALLMEGRGRRVFLTAPEHSLLLRKATSAVPHGGGLKIEPGSLRYRLLLRWITEGAPLATEGTEPIVAIEVEPAEQVLLAGGMRQLRVVAIDAAGNRRCVTTEAEYSSNAPAIADVDSRGWVTASDIPGEAAILARYMGQVAVCRVTLPRPGVTFARPAENNFIDCLVWDKLTRLGIPPSPLADDATFLRRVFLDVTGTLPTPEEARAFLASTEPDRRARLIDALLDQPEYADYWTMRWSDILRVDKDKLTPQGAVGMTRWLRRQLAENRPYDQFVRDVLTVQGDTTGESPAGFYKALDTPELLGRSVSQVFLGVRIECAQCHHHPFERWGQDDYFAFAGYFTGISRKPLASGAEAVFAVAGKDLNHPRTTLPVPTKALGAPAIDLAKVADRRAALADWLTAPDNPFLARTLVNRLWAHYLGRGLVEPIDDIRATNPATNEPLLDALAAHLRETGYDVRAFTRTVLNSRVYQLSADPVEGNADDEQNFSHATRKALPAEVLLDAICQATDVPEKFIGWPEGYRAVQIWDNRLPSYFFQIFGRPVRASVCECERSNDPSIAQALHLMNSPEVAGKIADRQGRARRLAASDLPPSVVIEELFLATVSRPPRPDELQLLLPLFGQSESTAGDADAVEAGRRAAAEDVLWALVNSKEFLYNR